MILRDVRDYCSRIVHICHAGCVVGPVLDYHQPHTPPWPVWKNLSFSSFTVTNQNGPAASIAAQATIQIYISNLYSFRFKRNLMKSAIASKKLSIAPANLKQWSVIPIKSLNIGPLPQPAILTNKPKTTIEKSQALLVCATPRKHVQEATHTNFNAQKTKLCLQKQPGQTLWHRGGRSLTDSKSLTYVDFSHPYLQMVWIHTERGYHTDQPQFPPSSPFRSPGTDCPTTIRPYTTPRREVKRGRQNATQELNLALQEAGFDFAVPYTRSGKMDLSYKTPRQQKKEPRKPVQNRSVKQFTRKHHAHREALDDKHREMSAGADDTLPLKSVLAKLITVSRHNAVRGNAIPSLEAEILKWLNQNQIERSQLDSWVHFLTCPAVHNISLHDLHKMQIPTGVILYFLRRENVNMETLRSLLNYLWLHLQPETRPFERKLEFRRNHPLRTYLIQSHVPNDAIFILFIRMLRHARRTWPEGIPKIAKLIPVFLHYHKQAGQHHVKNEMNKLTKLTFVYNKALLLISKPAAVRPMRSSIFQEWAQFDLIRAMSEHDPPIAVTPEGYRGIVTIQLARKKTDQERDWALLQAKSWPPWKRNRLGLDEDKGISYGTSRAATVLNRMAEAGYAAKDWDTVARIFAGWDTDGSPTVATRTFHVHSSGASLAASVWTARIMTTRTIREAWACFLSWRDSGAEPDAEVYGMMIYKLLLEHAESTRPTNATTKDNFNELELGNRALGERLEPFAEPTSPLEETYIRIPPPDALALFDEMIALGVKPSATLLERLVLRARSLSEALHFLSSSSPGERNLMTYLQTFEGPTPAQWVLKTLIRIFCRHPNEQIPVGDFFTQDAKSMKYVAPNMHGRRWQSLMQAVQMLLHQRINSQETWLDVLKILAATPNLQWEQPGSFGKTVRVISTMQLVLVMLHRMKEIGLELGTGGFAYVCQCVQNDAIARMRSISTEVQTRNHLMAANVPADHVEAEADDNMGANLSNEDAVYLRNLFQQVIGRSVMFSDFALKPVQHEVTPTAAELHKYVRALGTLGDHEGIWSLVQWLVTHKDDMIMVQREFFNGERKMRVLLTSIRVFLEYPWLDVRVLRNSVAHRMTPASEELLTLVEKTVDGVEEWGGWPSMAEVDLYIGRLSPDVSDEQKLTKLL